MKNKLRNKIKKEDVILVILIFIFALIMNNAFLRRHYSSDTMCLIDLGYFEYPLNFFLLDGRIVSALVCFIGGILNLSIETYLLISVVIGILMLSISIVILYKFIINYLEIKNGWINYMLLFSIYTIIFNHMNIDYLLYQESCVMCLGLLFSVLAAISYAKQGERSIIKPFVLLLISTMCYQGLTSIFPTLALTLLFLKKKQDKKETIKFYIKHILILGLLFSLSMLASVVVIAVFNNILGSSTNRLERVNSAWQLIFEIPSITWETFLEQLLRLPKYLAFIVTGVTSVIIIRYKNLNMVLKYFLVNITAYLFCVLPIVVYGYLETRLLMAIGATMGISLLFLTSLLLENQENISIKNLKVLIISGCVIAYFMFNLINNYNNSYWHLVAFQRDEKIGKQIAEVIRKYEEETGNEVTKFSYYKDTQAQRYERGVKPLGVLTERKFCVPIKESLNYYCNKDLEEVRFLSKVYYKKFYNRNYTEFNEKQLVFIDDTMYMCVY